MKSNRSYRSAIVGLCAMLAILLIAFGVLIAVSQPTATTVALAESSDEIASPVVDALSDPQATDGANASTSVSPVETIFSVNSAAPNTDEPLATAEQLAPAEKIYASARYLATYLALGCYEGLPGADELYNQLLGEIGISIMDNETLVDEIEAVTAALNASPDLWHHYADETLNRSLLPA